MKLTKLYLALLCLGFITVSCRKETPQDTGFTDVSNSRDMKVPANFDYQTSKNIPFNFAISSIWDKKKIRLDLYDALPSANGSIIASRFFDGFGKVEGNFDVPTTLSKVYAVVTYPDGSSEMAQLFTQNNSFNYTFGKKTAAKKTAVVSPDCSSGCDYSHPNYSGWSGISQSGTHCYTGTISGSISVWTSGVTIRICGSGTLSNLNLNNGAILEIVDGANVTIDNFSEYSSSDQLIIYPNASLTITNSMNFSGSVVNYGSLQVNQSMHIYSAASFTNNGSTSVQNDFANDKTFENNGPMSIGGKCDLNSNSNSSNSCQITVGGNFKLDKTFTMDGGYISVSQLSSINSGSKVNMSNGAMFVTGNVTMDGQVIGSGTTSLFKVNGTSTLYSSSKIKGSIQYDDADGIETNQASFQNGAILDNSVYIPTSSCNPEGNGMPAIADADNDGVADDVDVYPNDPTASGATSYPSNQDYATLAFEDLWPAQGDYDFNDLVVAYKYTLVTNSDNNVVRVESQFIVKAIGGSLANGLGFQFNVAPSVISSVTGQLLTQNAVTLSSNGTEQGQSKATIIASDNLKKTIINPGGMFVNTVPGEDIKYMDTINLVITFTSPQTIASLGAGPYNPFIFRSDTRGKEIHLPDNAPTDLVDASIFGQSADDSKPAQGRYYKTANNLPWALNIMGEFDYPIEKTDIVEAFNYFDLWAQSGGTQHTDWYVDLSGYRDSSKIY